MRKLFAYVLCLTLLLTGQMAGAERAGDALKIGTPTQLSGDFFTEMWGNNTADMDVRALIHGQSTVAFNGGGNFALDMSVLKDAKQTDDAEGNRTYAFTLNEQLAYSDGSALTAKDYVFSALLLADPRMTDLGSVSGALAHLAGFQAYVDGVRSGGTSVPFTGVRLISDLEFSVTIAHDFLPYYYELALVNIQPYPMSVIAPGCDVADDGDGAYIMGPFSTELLQTTVLDLQTGYRYFPKIATGPYMLNHYDRDAHVATLSINPNYPGNFEGQKPSIPNLTIETAMQDDMIERLVAGELDLVNKVSGGDQINQGRTQAKDGLLSNSNYLRAGFSYLSFACEKSPTQSIKVREAIAMCLDEQVLVEQFLKGYGLVSYGYYGYGQWMASDAGDEVLQLAKFALNTNGAIGLLEQDGWTLNAEGAPYDDELGGVRCRQATDGAIEKLSITLAIPDNSDAGKLVAEMLKPNAEQAGIELIVTELPYAELLRHYYRQTDREYDIFFTATNFNLLFDPYYTFSTDPAYQGVFNTTGIQDEQLMQLADDMRKTSPDDKDGYREKWLRFQQRFVDVLPLVPLYSNIYFDFFRPDLQNYRPNAYWSFSSALLYAYLGETEAQPLESDAEQSDAVDTQTSEDAETLGEGEIVILN